MATNKITVIDLYHSLTPKEQRQALAILRKAEQTPCEAKGHSMKQVKSYQTGLFGCGPQVVIMVCTKCGLKKVV